ncbi:MAG: cytochrome b, partial [Pseudomonadota bacterium]|nr:cytochrome b [Pseudomonadota bacterium]
SILLHWLLVVLLVSQVIIGVYFSDWAKGPEKGRFFFIHFSLGVTILLLSLFRLGWRLSHPAPPLPDHYATWERLLARATHVGFYLVMIGMPLTGWIMTSGNPRPLPDVWGLLPWPKAPGVGEGLGEAAHAAHVNVILPFFWVLLFLHVAGALKHQFLDRDETLWRMLPLVGRPKAAGR